MNRVHYVGIAGSGVGALAQFHAMGGGQATGSDRSFDRGEASPAHRNLEHLGIRIFPQDASALALKPDYLVVSGAVELEIADIKEARAAGIEIRHRADELARIANQRKTIAVAGTSGKSTVAAMIFAIFSGAGLDPSIITGGELVELKERGLIGNAWRGKSDWLVIEADESDGTLVRYASQLGVILNVSKDHKEVAELKNLFREFKSRSKTCLISADPGLSDLRAGSLVFGEGGGLRAESVELGPLSSKFSVEQTQFILPCPGAHDVENALAAIAAARAIGVPLETAARALSQFRGVARRFEFIGEARGVRVIDDFAHNPAKIEAAIRAAKLGARRVLAVFQLHGYAPARFLKNEFIDAFARALDPDDQLWMPEIYYAGGSVTRDISTEGIADAVAARGRRARFAPHRDDIPALIAKEAREGDVILSMGARDPSLPEFARKIFSSLLLAR
ncbi:MAG TPA: Mur ligase domain-containing protein [Elusimicrobiota bacterium]|nr:Mur ligase domain-containing protein [Elusimicrobiota bacterium]